MENVTHELSVIETLNYLCKELQSSNICTYIPLAGTIESSLTTNKVTLTIISVPTKYVCASSLVGQQAGLLKQPQAVTNYHITEKLTMHEILSLFTLVGTSDSWLLFGSSEIEYIKIVSLFELPSYLMTPTMDTLLFVLTLLYSKETQFYDSAFKQFISKNIDILTPNHQKLCSCLQSEVAGMLNRTNQTYKLSTNVDFRNKTFDIMYNLFNMILIIQNFVSTGVPSTKLNEDQIHASGLIKVAGKPWSYIELTVHNLIKSINDTEVAEYSDTIQNSNKIKDLFIYYFISYFMTPVTDIK